MAGRSARREAKNAAAASRAEAENFRQQTASLQEKTARAQIKAQRMLMRSLRSRGAGFFETDFLGGDNNPLGGGGL